MRIFYIHNIIKRIIKSKFNLYRVNNCRKLCKNDQQTITINDQSTGDDGQRAFHQLQEPYNYESNSYCEQLRDYDS